MHEYPPPYAGAAAFDGQYQNWYCGLPRGRIARVLFCVEGGGMVLLHGFIKKTQKTPQREIELALRRKREGGS